MIIRNAELKDLESIAHLERKIEGENAATKEVLFERLKMFKDGFYVAEKNGKILGYIESCLWNKINFRTFSEIKDFPKHHNPKGRILYIIFLGVDETQRRKGIGSRLVRTLQEYASEKRLEKVQLVAGEGFLTSFYKNLGFRVVKELPSFLPYSKGTLMEYRVTPIRY